MRGLIHSHVELKVSSCEVSTACLLSPDVSVGRLQDVEMVEDGAKHTLVLYNCKVPLTGEVAFSAANAKCCANLKVKGER